MDYQNNEFDVIEDFDDISSSNQIMASRNNLQRSHIPEDFMNNNRITGKVHERINLPDLSPSPETVSNMQAMLGSRQMPTSNPPLYNYPSYPGVSGSVYPQQYQNQQYIVDNTVNPELITPITSIYDNYNSHNSLSCKSVVGHVDHCNICSSYFWSREKMYWIVIVILVLMILLLLKSK